LPEPQRWPRCVAHAAKQHGPGRDFPAPLLQRGVPEWNNFAPQVAARANVGDVSPRPAIGMGIADRVMEARGKVAGDRSPWGKQAACRASGARKKHENDMKYLPLARHPRA
jgi:hypothetical protein